MTINLDTEHLQHLIRDAQSGDPDAFEALIQSSYDVMYRFAFRWCQNQDAASDITQASCMKLADHIRQFRHEASYSSWLYKIVLNASRDWQRHENRHQHLSLNEDDLPSGHCPDGENQHYLQQILGRLDKLGKGYRETALLVLAEGLTHAEAAEVLDVSESTVAWRIHDIRKQMATLRKEPSS